MTRTDLNNLVLGVFAIAVMVLTGLVLISLIVTIWAPDPWFWLRVVGTLSVLLVLVYLLGTVLETVLET